MFSARDTAVRQEQLKDRQRRADNLARLKTDETQPGRSQGVAGWFSKRRLFSNRVKKRGPEGLTYPPQQQTS